MIQDANWISTSADIGEICPIFSKEIKINKTVKKSVISISATGVYEARLNDNSNPPIHLYRGYTIT